MRMIGIGGRMGSGKDTLADILVKEFRYKKLAFASNLKHMCQKVFNLSHYDVYNYVGKNTEFSEPIYFNRKQAIGIISWVINTNRMEVPNFQINLMKDLLKTNMMFNSPRDLIQKVATEICRTVFGFGYHIKVITNNIERNKWDNVVISDMRFENERKFIKEQYGGITWLINCPQVKDTGSHKSETSLGSPKDYDIVLVNDKKRGHEYLEEQVLSLMFDIEDNKLWTQSQILSVR